MNAYIYAAALFCEACAASLLGVGVDGIRDEIGRRRSARGLPDGATDTDAVPDGPYSDGGGESDCPAHCDGCGLFLENPLTSDGYAFVRDAIINGDGDPEVLAEWASFYVIGD